MPRLRSAERGAKVNDVPRRFPPTDAEIVREFCAEADDPMALTDTMGLGAVGPAVEARRELARRLAEAREARREASEQAVARITEAIERARGAFSEMRERLEYNPPAEALKPKKRLAVITGVASGLHLGAVPPGSEAPYSSVPVSLCGIGNSHLLDIRWKKLNAPGAPTCEGCWTVADHLFADDEAEWFDYTERQPMWQAPRPEVRYEFCSIESPDGMLDLPPARISGDEEAP